MRTPAEHRAERADRRRRFRLRKVAAGGRRLAKIARGLPPGGKLLTVDATGQLRGTPRRSGS